MTTIKVVTDFGIQDVKITKRQEIRGELFGVGIVPVKYMNREEPLMIRYAIHIKTGKTVPLTNINHTHPVKDYFLRIEDFLKGRSDTEIKTELAKFEIINP